MKVPGVFAIFLFVVGFSGWTADTNSVAESEAAQRDRLYQRWLTDLWKGGFTNVDLALPGSAKPLARELFDATVIHPSFGLYWDEIPPPTLTNADAIASVNAFLATNGWNMQTGNLVFGYAMEKPKKIRGLPWKVICDREFNAVSHEGILYVLFPSVQRHAGNGVAYNPKTNAFAPAISGFKHVGQHWYAWGQPEDPIKLTQQYEGQKP